MKSSRKLVYILIVISLVSTFSNANAVENYLSGVVKAILPEEKKRYKKRYKKRSTKKHAGSGIPNSCLKQPWSTNVVDNRLAAKNSKHLLVSYNEMGDITIKIPVPKANTDASSLGNVGVAFKFNKGNKITTAILDDGSQNLIISSADTEYIINKLKSSSFVSVEYLNSKNCSRLKGSGNALSAVESSAKITKNSLPDHIRNARVKRASSEHSTHASKLASNQKELSDKVIGIRAKSNLDKLSGENFSDVKIQYYVPGSEDIGEMWVNWHIDDKEGPMMRLHFMDPTNKYDKEDYAIDVSLSPIEAPCDVNLNIKPTKDTSPACRMVKDLLRTDKWGKIAEKQGLKRRYAKRASYIDGNASSTISTSVRFLVYEDGAMTAQIEQMKFGFPKQFNFTLTNALELAKYIEDTRKIAYTKWMNKTRTSEDLDALFN
ncbi:MAG TPA: hypothetical protein EYG74_05855 [Sulfurimonas autotrophica]|nr:hypothetical protein [Sulfurimonas autotrophica]